MFAGTLFPAVLPAIHVVQDMLYMLSNYTSFLFAHFSALGKHLTWPCFFSLLITVCLTLRTSLCSAAYPLPAAGNISMDFAAVSVTAATSPASFPALFTVVDHLDAGGS